MNSILKVIIVTTSVAIFVTCFIGNFQDTLTIKEETTINASIQDVIYHLTDQAQFAQWYPNVDTLYLDSLDNTVWVIEDKYRDSILKTSLRINSTANSVDYKMWTAAYNSRTDISLLAKGDSTLLKSKTTLSGTNVLVSGINKLTGRKIRRKISEGYLLLKARLEDSV